jgi:hypothetical protein
LSGQDDEFYQRLFLHQLKRLCDFCPHSIILLFYVAHSATLLLLICICWTILALLQWNQLDYGL